jgi:hypothetical protein
MLPAVERAGRRATGLAIEYGETVIRDIGALAAVPSRGAAVTALRPSDCLVDLGQRNQNRSLAKAIADARWHSSLQGGEGRQALSSGIPASSNDGQAVRASLSAEASVRRTTVRVDEAERRVVRAA